MQEKIKNQKKFVQIPILVVVIISITVVLGISYGIIEYHKISKIIKESEQLTKQESKNKLEKTQNTITETQTSEEINQVSKGKSKDNTQEKSSNVLNSPKQSNFSQINASEIEPYLSGVGQIICSDGINVNEGSGSLFWINNKGTVLTNKHIIPSNSLIHCTLFIDEVGTYELDISEIKVFKNMDAALFTIKNPKSDSSAPINSLNYNLLKMKVCPPEMPLNSPVIVIGYPAFSQKTITFRDIIGTQSFRAITNGIISAYDTSVKYAEGLPYPNYFVSAKVDSGNSGGIAISKIQENLCILGIPTWLSVGVYETQGLVLNFYNFLHYAY